MSDTTDDEAGPPYPDDRLVRDIVYFYYECWNYRTIPSDLNYGVVLELPYYRYFQSPDPFIRQGSILIFVGILEEWDAGAGLPFTLPQHPFGEYLSALVDAYMQADHEGNSPTQPLLAMALADLAAIDARHPIDRDGDLAPLDTSIVATFRSIVAERRLQEGSASVLSHPEMYLKYIKPYFIEWAR